MPGASTQRVASSASALALLLVSAAVSHVTTSSITRWTRKLSKRQVCRDIRWLTQWW
jgi:hypothetical protein